MTQARTRWRLSGPAIGLAVAAFAVGGLSASVVATDVASAASSAKANSLTVSTIKNGALGTILVSNNSAVYTVKANKTKCTAACLKVWPEVLLAKGVKHATAGNGVIAKKLGTVKRGGRLQVTYSGKPLYWLSGATATGQVSGNITDLWGKWSVVVTAKPAHGAQPAVVATTTPPTTNAPTTTTATPTTSRTAPPPSPTTQPPPPPPTTTPTTTPPPPPTTTTSPGGGGVGF